MLGSVPCADGYLFLISKLTQSVGWAKRSEAQQTWPLLGLAAQPTYYLLDHSHPHSHEPIR